MKYYKRQMTTALESVEDWLDENGEGMPVKEAESVPQVTFKASPTFMDSHGDAFGRFGIKILQFNSERPNLLTVQRPSNMKSARALVALMLETGLDTATICRRYPGLIEDAGIADGKTVEQIIQSLDDFRLGSDILTGPGYRNGLEATEAQKFCKRKYVRK